MQRCFLIQTFKEVKGKKSKGLKGASQRRGGENIRRMVGKCFFDQLTKTNNRQKIFNYFVIFCGSLGFCG